MRAVIERLRAKPASEVTVFDRAYSWEIQIPKPSGLVVELWLPYDVLESFVGVRQPPGDRMLWRDWCDYHAYQGSDAELRTYRAEDVDRFVERLLRSPVRIREDRGFLGRRRHHPEWQTAGRWERLLFPSSRLRSRSSRARRSP
jgi:hypothetical protein